MPLPIQSGIAKLGKLMVEKHLQSPELHDLEIIAAECQRNTDAQDSIWKYLMSKKLNTYVLKGSLLKYQQSISQF